MSDRNSHRHLAIVAAGSCPDAPERAGVDEGELLLVGDIAKAVGRDRKGNISLFFYVISIPLTFFSPMAACACFAIVALIWLVPDKRIERVVLK